MGGEYTPVYPPNCMIYGIGRSCVRCALGYFKLKVGSSTEVDKCIAKDTTTGFCPSTNAGA
jgi:hypothetical protein